MDIRGRFLIDPDGVLQGHGGSGPAVGRNVAEMIRQIRACQYVKGTCGRSHPGGWEPGKKDPEARGRTGGKVCEIWAPDMAF